MNSESNLEPGAVRISSVDTYRGAVMLLMMAEVLELARVAKAIPTSSIWQALAYHQTHVAWRGCSVHDMIQPSFSFLVGVALPFSMASRLRHGESTSRAIGHAAWRSVVLILLGIFLRSVHRSRTYFTFEDTLTQIGLGYLPLFLLGLAKPRIQWIAIGLILIGYWVAFEIYPAPGPDFDFSSRGVDPSWVHPTGALATHWDKNSNLAWAFDRWFLNLFPRESRFEFNRGGYATLSFIPTLATMLLGLVAGRWIQGRGDLRPLMTRLILTGLAGIALGWALDWWGVCPLVKRIWTPSWVIFSGGICFLVLASLYLVIDRLGFSSWTWPLRVIGRNSIAAYCLAELTGEFIRSSIRIHLGQEFFRDRAGAYEPFVEGAMILAVFWLILAWMDRRRIYLKV